MLEQLFAASGDFVPEGTSVMSGSSLVSSPRAAVEVHQGLQCAGWTHSQDLSIPGCH